MGRVANCLVCRAPFDFPAKVLRLVARPPGQHTPTALFNLALMYANGTGVPQDHTEAVRLFRLAVDQGDAGAQCYLGVMYTNGTEVPQDHAERSGCTSSPPTRGRPKRSTTSVMYEHGTGVQQDHAESARLYRLAADQGEARAQFNLALMYEDGTGVPQDHAEAARLYRLAADLGHAGAQAVQPRGDVWRRGPAGPRRGGSAVQALLRPGTRRSAA